MIDEASRKMAQAIVAKGPRRSPAVLNDDPVVASAAQARNKPKQNKPNNPEYRGCASGNPSLVTRSERQR